MVIEKILGRPLSQKTQERFFRIGMFLLLSLMFFTTFNDLKDVGLFKFFKQLYFLKNPLKSILNSNKSQYIGVFILRGTNKKLDLWALM